MTPPMSDRSGALRCGRSQDSFMVAFSSKSAQSTMFYTLQCRGLSQTGDSFLMQRFVTEVTQAPLRCRKPALCWASVDIRRGTR